MVWSELDGLVIALHGRLELLKAVQYIATAEVGAYIGWIHLNRPVDEFKRGRILSNLIREHSLKMQRPRMAGSVLQNLPIERFCLRQLPGSVVGDGLRKQLVRR